MEMEMDTELGTERYEQISRQPVMNAAVVLLCAGAATVVLGGGALLMSDTGRDFAMTVAGQDMERSDDGVAGGAGSDSEGQRSTGGSDGDVGGVTEPDDTTAPSPTTPGRDSGTVADGDDGAEGAVNDSTQPGWATGRGGVYQVVRGDTLAKISSTTGISVDRLVAYNDIIDPNLIYAGSALEIPPQQQ